MASARNTVCELLLRMQNKAYSNILLDSVLKNDSFEKQEKNFISSLFYGVIERKITLDHIIKTYSNKPLNKIDREVIVILEMGIYQLIYMESVPDSAAVNESVKLAEKFRKSSAKGFVNAVLRNFIRDKKEIKLPQNKLEKFSVLYSTPIWLVNKFLKEYPTEVEDILKSTVTKPNVYLRVNTTRITTDELIEILNSENVDCKKIEGMENCLFIEKSFAIENHESFKKGMFHVQDISSQICCRSLEVKDTDVVFDICAAPGGKTFTLSEMMDNKGEIYAFDLHEKRVNLIKQGSVRLGLTNIKAMCGNGREFNKDLPQADKILCDVPCSGLGVIGKKPEIKYKDENELKDLPEIQYKILCNAAKYLKIGGELVYSTCSLSIEENDEVVEKFLKEHKNFAGADIMNFGYKRTIFPQEYGSDGFFISKVRRKI